MVLLGKRKWTPLDGSLAQDSEEHSRVASLRRRLPRPRSTSQVYRCRRGRRSRALKMRAMCLSLSNTFMKDIAAVSSPVLFAHGQLVFGVCFSVDYYAEELLPEDNDASAEEQEGMQHLAFLLPQLLADCSSRRCSAKLCDARNQRRDNCAGHRPR